MHEFDDEIVYFADVLRLSMKHLLKSPTTLTNPRKTIQKHGLSSFHNSLLV
jgi:hypothetical protein